MNFLHWVLFVCFLPSVFCNKDGDGCTVFYILGGITMLLMSIAIIGLALALYMVKNNKSILGFSFTERPTYVRQESGIGVTLRTVTSTKDINEQCRNNGSTLTVNSDVFAERGAISEPHTPIREENKLCYAKKPIGPIIPTFQKAQMDEIIKNALNRQKKSDSATFREIDALAKQKTPKFGESELNYGNIAASISEVDGFSIEDNGECLYGNALAINLMKTQTEVKEKSMESKKSQTNTPKMREAKEHTSKTSLPAEYNEDDHEVYDTLPNPVRCKENRKSDGSDVENVHLYDLPPTKSWEPNDNRSVVMDHDTQYLLPISNRPMDKDEEKTCYVNAKVRTDMR